MAMTADAERRSGAGRFALILGFGALVSLSLGVYGSVHDPTGRSLVTLFFTRTITLKVWLATAVAVLAVAQVVGALRLYGKLGKGSSPPWLGIAHRSSGTLAFLLAIPVAYHCLWALGFNPTEPRTLIHSLAGCFVFGAFAAKMLTVRSHRLPGWALPTIGGLLFTGLTIVWLTSALWFFTTVGFEI
jgi:hypothetical protein